MGKYKENPRYNVVSIRLSDPEKDLLEELSRHRRTTVAILMREALHRHMLTLLTPLKRRRWDNLLAD